jgi:hypothetical protein
MKIFSSCELYKTTIKSFALTIKVILLKSQ